MPDLVANNACPVYCGHKASVTQRVYAIGRFPITPTAGFDPTQTWLEAASSSPYRLLLAAYLT